MDSCSSNASSVTSFDLEAEQEVAEKPLSPVLSTSKLSHKAFFDRRVSKQKSRVKLASKFNQDVYSGMRSENVNDFQNISTVSRLKAVDVYEEQRRRYYDLLCDDSAEDIYKEQQFTSEATSDYNSVRSSPVQQNFNNKLQSESIERTVNYHCNQNEKTLRFCTAAGKCIDISEESLQKSNEIFEDVNAFQDDYSVFKNPTAMKKKLSKIPRLNQTRKNVIKTKSTRSTYEEIQINMSDIMVTQTQVDCYEDFVQNETSDDYSISNTDDSKGTLAEDTFTDSTNKIFGNKKFMEFSTSSMDNTTYNDTFTEVGDVFNYKKNVYKPTLENVLDEDWNDTKNFEVLTEEELRKIAVEKFKCQKQAGNTNRREASLSPSRKRPEIGGTGNKKRNNNEKSQCPPVEPNEEVNIDAATSKNLVIVTMAPANCDKDNSYRSVVELHRNTHFNQSNDSVQHFQLPVEPVNSRKNPTKGNKQEEFLGFSTEEQQQAKNAFMRVTEAVQRTDEGLKSEKKRNEKKTKKNKRKDHEKCSVESPTVYFDESLEKKEKLKHRKPKKETESKQTSSRKMKSRNTSVVRQTKPTRETEIGDGVTKGEEIKTITYDHLSIVAEQCKKLSNHKKRKELSEFLPANCAELNKEHENKTIELSPNQKKFKIEIDCNSKFRINISCNGDPEVAAKAIEALDTNDKTVNVEKNSNLSEICSNKVNCPSGYDLEQPKGKLIKKLINKTEKDYRDMKHFDVHLSDKKEEKIDEQRQTEKDRLFKIPANRSKNPKFTKKNDNEYTSEKAAENFKRFMEFDGFKSAGGKDLKFSEKSLNKAKKMYEGTCENKDVEETQGEATISVGLKTKGEKNLKISEKTTSKAKKIYQNIENYVEEKNKNDCNQLTNEDQRPKKEFSGFITAGGKDIKFSEKALNKAKKIYDTTCENKDTVEKTQEEPPIGFKTAGGKNVKISEKAVSRATKIYQNIDNYLEEKNKNIPNNECASSRNFIEFSGFKTAGQNDIKCSEKSMNKAKKMYGATHENNDNESQEQPTINLGFKTAGGKDVNVSGKSVNRAKKIYRDIDNYLEGTNPHVDVAQSDKITQQDKVANRMKKLYDSLNIEHNINENTNFIEDPTTLVDKNEQTNELTNPIDTKPTFDLRNCGFTTASGNSVIISEKAINTGKKIFESITDENKTKEVEEPIKEKKPWSHCNNAVGFQTGLGEEIDVTSKGVNKAKSIFGDLSFQAGDYESTEHDKKIEDPFFKSESFTVAQIYHQVGEPPNFSMGDFLPSSENTTFDKTFPMEEEEGSTLLNKRNLNSKSSKKAFELLEDVVETVDNALQSIDERGKRPRLSVSRKRLGTSRFKQINIPNEKLERAKLLFKEDLDSTVLNMRGVVKPIKISQPTFSTPNLKRQESMSNQCLSDNQRGQGTIIADTLTSSVLICERTKGDIDDWFSLIDNRVEFMKMQLKDLEEKKGYLFYQKEMLDKNKLEAISPQPGVLIRKKEHTKLHLKDLKTNNYRTGDTSEFIFQVTPQNAIAVHFTFERSNDCMNLYTTLDGALVIPNIHNIIGYTEIDLAFKTMPGVDTKLIPHGWIENHYKLIVWKLASYERFLSLHLRGCLSVENVMQQLKYRYDREIDRAERPALRKILEKDDVPQRRIVWCVSNIEETSRNEIELTDGWYCLNALIDEGLVAQINKNKIKVGTKLVTSGALILNCEGCHPLEVPPNVKLKISYNSTRRAPWYSRLGYQRCAKPLLVPLHSIRPDGGMIGCVKMYIARVYPLRFMEQVNGTKIWRNSKAEEKRAREFENERLNKMEKVHYDVQKKYEHDKMQEKRKNLPEHSKLGKNELLKVTCPKTLLSVLESSNDPDVLMEYLSPSQRTNVLEYRQTVCLERQHEISRKISEEMEKLKLAKRKVVSILKLLVLDATCESDKPHQFCLWNPSEEDLKFLKEYNVYYAYNVLPRFNGELFSTNKTYFKLDRKMLHNKFKRQAYPIAMLLDPHYRPSFNEFDTVGVVIYVNVMDSEQSLWLADSHGNILFIKVRDGPKFCRLLDDISGGDIVSVQNLLYCPPQANFGVAIANQFTVVTKSMQNYLRECMERLKLQLPKDLARFLGECTAKIEKSSAMMETKNRAPNDVSFLQCGLILPQNSTLSLDDSSEEDSIIPQKLTATDIAMSLIDTDQFI